MKPIDRMKTALAAAGIDARDPAAYTGKCRAPYAVVYSGGDMPLSRTTRRIVVNVLLNVPVAKPEQMPGLRESTRAAAQSAGFFDLQADEDGVLDNYEALTGLMSFYALGGM